MMRGKLAIRILGGLLVILALTWFASANGDQSVDVRLGLFTLRGLSLPVVIFAAVIVGMLIVLAAGLRGDLRTGEAMRGERIAPGAPREAGAAKQSTPASTEQES
jgi:uncharacterized integral membrane protein